MRSFALYLAEGKRYEVVLTTFNGLYRYRTEDIIRVVGHYHSLPVWEVSGRSVAIDRSDSTMPRFEKSVYFRRGQYLSVADEHVTEIELRSIIEPLTSVYKDGFTTTVPQYSVFIDKKGYVIAMELDAERGQDKKALDQMTKQLCLKFDQQLQESNEEYKTGRDRHAISSPTVLWVKCNTLTTGTREFRAKKAKGSGANQLKSQLIINDRNKDVIKFIKKSAV